MAAPTPAPESGIVWLSGPILTFLNKVVFPAVWSLAVAGIPLWVFATTGRLSLAAGFGFIAAFALLGMVFGVWFAIHTQRVGYCGRELVVANYLRRASIPFENVAEVERVWWGKGQVVRIRFSCPTAFGFTVYYVPKWAPLRALFGTPEAELKRVIADPL